MPTRCRSLWMALLSLALLVPGVAGAQGFRVVTLAEGLAHPWGMAFLPDGRMLVTERPGRLRLIENGRLLAEPVGGPPEIAAYGQGGLLDVVLHPAYRENGWIYLSYVAGGRDGVGTEVGCGRLQGRRLVDWQRLFRLLPKSGTGAHFGSRLVFDRAGDLYITLGDRGERWRAQDLGDDAGSVIRLHDDGRIPRDNPFVDLPGARGAIFSYGHRNAQGAALEPRSGRIWIHEHGPQGGDEINRLRSGANYGWPVVSHGTEYGSGIPVGEGSEKPGIEPPLYYWVPSIAPSGMAFYQGERFPQWRGDLFAR